MGAETWWSYVARNHDLRCEPLEVLYQLQVVCQGRCNLDCDIQSWLKSEFAGMTVIKEAHVAAESMVEASSQCVLCLVSDRYSLSQRVSAVITLVRSQGLKQAKH